MHPYKAMPPYTRWRSMTGANRISDIDPVGKFGFKIKRTDKVATAGSCFAQNIARRLRASGFNYFVVEDAPDIFDAELKRLYNFGTYTCRYGNIYTTRQLLQLFQQAFGAPQSREVSWAGPSGNFYDPLRPNIQPDGFSSLDELLYDRKHHLASVRKMMTELDYFVFTLGLTEAWVSVEDGTVYPLCPGVAAGEFSPICHRFKNFTVSEVVADLTEALTLLSTVNRRAKVILTVSPVPLAATAEDHHVLQSTVYSKSVLRVACEEVRARMDNVEYFPSFEIVTGGFTRGAYFDDDLRTVNEEGVSHVMDLFFKHATESNPGEAAPPLAPDTASAVATTSTYDRSRALNAVLCDEEMLLRA